VAATFHVAGFDDKKGTTGLRVFLSAACLPVAHEDEGLHAIYDFVVNSDSFML
jgi:hypothetical protein